MTCSAGSAMHRALVWATAALLSGLTPASAQKTLVRFGYFSESMPLAVACARRWLDTDEYAVACFPQSSGMYAVSKLDQGDLDVSLLGSTPAAISNSRGVRAFTFQMAHGHGSSQGLAVRSVHGPSELMGKCLASPFGSTAHYHLLFALHMLDLPICPVQTGPAEQIGCDVVDATCVTLVDMSPSGLMAAWDSERIDGAFIWGEGFLHLKSNGGTVIVDSDDLKRWGKETFIVVAARDSFVEDFPGLLEHIARVKLVLDDSWLADNVAWDAHREGNSTLLASVSHFLSKSRPREVEAWNSHAIYNDMSSKEFFATQTQLGCQYLSHSSCSLNSGLAEKLMSTSMFFMDQKGLATTVPTGKHFHIDDPASYFDDMIDSTVLFAASSDSVTLDSLITATGNEVALPTGSVETGSCESGSLSYDESIMMGSFTDKPGLSSGTLGASYINGMVCTFRIPPPAIGTSYLVEVNFSSFRVWSGDVVRLYEENGVDPTGKLLAQLQGIDPAIPPIRSAGGIIIQFLTDQNTEECYNMPESDGWEVNFDRRHPGCTGDESCVHGICIEQPLLGYLRNVCECVPGWGGADCSFPGCLGTVATHAAAGTFRSGVGALQHAHRYENSAACIFEVHSTETLVRFSIQTDLEETFDWLEVRAGTGTDAVVHSRLTGYLTLTVTVPTIDGIASLYYATDDKGRRSGFQAEYVTDSASCQSWCSITHGTCEGGACICEPGWAGMDCTQAFCAPGPLHYAGKTSGVIQSNANEYSILPMTDCHFETEPLSDGMVGTRLLVHTFDLESDSVGDFVTVSYDTTVLTLKVEACTSSADCSQSWQSGRCTDGVCEVRESIDVLTTVPLHVRVRTDRNDIAALYRRGVSMTWHAIAVCPEDGRTAWECVGPPGSCDCEVNDGTCSAYGTCECPGGQCACGCGGHVAQPPYWIFGLFVGIVMCMCAAGCLKRKHSKQKNQRRRNEAKRDADQAMRTALAAQAKMLELEKNYMKYPDEWDLDPEKTVSIDDENAPGGKRIVQMPVEGLVRVPETSPEYWNVYDLLTRPPDQDVSEVDPKTGKVSDVIGMRDAYITQLHRIQNPDLYAYFMHQRDRLTNSNSKKPEGAKAFDGQPTDGKPMGSLREVQGWHGTGVFPAENIYTDKQDGFMMQFASQGQWGRGLYFAAEAGYSHFYATKAASLQPDVRKSKGMDVDECELFLATLLVGNTVEMDRDKDGAMRRACRELKAAPPVRSCQVVPSARDGIDVCVAPPTDATAGLKYNTVRGYTQTDIELDDQSWIKNPDCPRSQVWIVYENGRAYPRYLVRYYRGMFDPKRVKYRNRAEAEADADATSRAGMTDKSSDGGAIGVTGRQPPRPPRRPPPPLPAQNTKSHTSGSPRATPRVGAQATSSTSVQSVEYQWKCEVEGNDMVDYPQPINALLEEAFNRSATSRHSHNASTIEFIGFRGMTYVADAVAGIQTNRATGVQRRMIRYVNGQPSSWVTMLDSSSGRYLYLNASSPGQPASWTRNPSCPSRPFSKEDVHQQSHANPLHGTQPGSRI